MFSFNSILYCLYFIYLYYFYYILRYYILLYSTYYIIYMTYKLYIIIQILLYLWFAHYGLRSVHSSTMETKQRGHCVVIGDFKVSYTMPGKIQFPCAAALQQAS